MSRNDHLRSKHGTLCSILDDSEETLISFSGCLLERKVIDRKVNNSVTRTLGIRGANDLVTHIELMVEQRPEILHTVLEVMEKEKCLEKVAGEIKREMGVDHADASVTSGATGKEKPFTPLKPATSIFQGHFAQVCDVVPETTCVKLGNDLLGARLLSASVLDNVNTNASLSRYERVSKYMTEIRRSLSVDNNPETIVSLSHVLKKQKNVELDKIANSMLTELGCPVKEERKGREKRKGNRDDGQSSKSKRKCVASSESDNSNSEDESEDSNCNDPVTVPSSESSASTCCTGQDSVKSDVLTAQDISEVTTALGSYPAWFTLGIQLKIPFDDLKIIENDYPRDSEKCKHHMVAAWIKTGEATWKKLANSLKTVKNISKANEINRKYVK